MQRLENVIVMGERSDITEKMQAKADEAGIKLYTFQEIVDIGAKEKEENGPHEIQEPTPEDVYMLSYTSGTTGNPKGVQLTHRMVLNAAQAVNQRFSGHPKGTLNTNDRYISYLPMAHSFEQCCFGNCLIYGMRCGFYSGNLLQLTSDLEVLKPTVFPSVPSFYNRIYGKIQKKFGDATGIKKLLIDKAVDAKLKNLRNGKGLHHKLFDKLVFDKTKAILGGEVRVCITGSAPISSDVIDFLKVSFMADVVNGYGMTEGCGASCSAKL